MTTPSTGARTLDYTRITGPGVDALDRRREHNDAEQVTAEQLQTSIDKVKTGIFKGLKVLSDGAAQLAKK
jgi:hypothetical protein